LFRKPGFLPLAYIKGQRSLYTKPLALYFLANFLFFFISDTDAFSTGLYSHMHYQKYKNLATQITNAKIANDDISLEQLTKLFDISVASNSKLFLILFVVLLSFCLVILYPSRKRYYSDHLTFSLSFMSFILFGIFLALPFIVEFTYLMVYKFTGYASGPDYNGNVFSLILLTLIGLYLYPALKRFYGQSVGLTLTKTFFMTILIFPVLLTYRFILFLVTLAMI
jgi:hypothetical protein